MSSVITHLSCFTSIANNRRLQLNTRSYPCTTNFRPGKVLNIMSSDERGSDVSNLKNKATLSYGEDISTSQNGNSLKSHPVEKKFVVGGPTIDHITEEVMNQPKKGAKIHDFCFGIPFGGLVLVGGLLGYLFSRNPATLIPGVLFGGAILALSTYSLKVWREGKSCLPFIFGQAALSVALLSINLKAYSLTQKLFPTGFNVVISAAMLCFYAYVVLSGGNPPPKRSKIPAVVATS